MTGAGEISLTTRVEDLPGVRPREAEALRAMGLVNAGRLVAHLPARHEREEAESSIAELASDSVVSARGEVTATRVSGFGRKKRFEAVLHDGSGRLDLVWFNMAYLANKIGAGSQIRVQGKANRRSGGMQLVNPRWELIEQSDEPAKSDARLRPVYPATEAIDSRSIERVIGGVLPACLPLLEDHLTEERRREAEMPKLADAYRMIHAPADDSEVTEAKRRLAYDELLMLQLGVHMKRAQRRRTLAAPAIDIDERLDERIRARLPFTLTDAQDRVVREIAGDLGKEEPANRLVQGDVGSGKTVVALYAMLAAVAAGHQGALMAPTSLLAEQHAESIGKILDRSGVRTALLTGATPEQDRDALLRQLATGEIDLVIGTHALLTERVRFASLAVVVIDEQHRFGVHQRATLRTKPTDELTADGRALTPHVFVMTATPIPRTLAMTLLGDLDVSTIDALPPGRQPIRTRVVGSQKRDEVYDWLRERLDAGEQAYIVTPSIDPAPATGDGPVPASLTEVMKLLEQGPLEDRRVAAMHGRMKAATRAHVMGRFRSGLIDALVATTVIEVGVDVPNATVMVIESAERFGLAPLHQLRGRVGRGSKASVCVLIGDPVTDDGRARLEAMAETGDGFVIAERDLAIRGPGELLGLRQSGVSPFRVADLERDMDLLRLASKHAAAWIEVSPNLGRAEDAVAKRRVFKIYGEALGLADVA